MKLPKRWTKVKLFPKISTVVLIISLLLIPFYLGIRYEKSKAQIPLKKQNTEVVSQVVPQKEDLEERCGKLPSEAYSNASDGWAEIKGPFWSPDCRYAISSLSVVGRGLPPGTDADKLVANIPVGIFLYTDSSKSLIKVYKNGAVEEWTDREDFTFTAEGKRYNYRVTDKNVTLFDF